MEWLGKLEIIWAHGVECRNWMYSIQWLQRSFNYSDTSGCLGEMPLKKVGIQAWMRTTTRRMKV